jgi:RNA polymerase sigma factor (sigma-70 family)
VKVILFPTRCATTSEPARPAESEDLPSADSPAVQPGVQPTRHAPRTARGRKLKRRRTPADVIAQALDRPRAHQDPAALLAQVLESSRLDVAPRERGPDRGIAEREAATVSAAFWSVWLAHRDYLHRFSLRFSSGNPADAEDAMSEAMLKAAQAFARSEIRNHRAWLLRLVHNACMDRHRVAQRQSRLAADVAGDAGDAAPALAPRLDRSPEELLAASQLTVGLQEALAALPRSLAGPLLLYLDGLSDAEIAASLNVSREVVRKRRQMARDLLRRQLLL